MIDEWNSAIENFIVLTTKHNVKMKWLAEQQ